MGNRVVQGAARPFIKWAGGKARLAPEFEKRGLFPSKFETYYEPFVGAGAVFFYLAPKRAKLSDTNEELVITYRVVRNRVAALITELKAMKTQHSKEYFYKVRKSVPDDLDDVARAARLIYLNRTCFNGLYRVNSKGQFNVPFGDYANPRIVDEDGLCAASRALKAAVSIDVKDFEKAVDDATKHDFVYFDPPYVPVSATSSFTSYTQGSFGLAEQKRLASVFNELSKRGVAVLLSNSDTPLVRKLYAGHEIVALRAARAINSRADRRGPVGEVAVLNRAPKQRSLRSFSR